MGKQNGELFSPTPAGGRVCILKISSIEQVPSGNGLIQWTYVEGHGFNARKIIKFRILNICEHIFVLSFLFQKAITKDRTSIGVDLGVFVLGFVVPTSGSTIA